MQARVAVTDEAFTVAECRCGTQLGVASSALTSPAVPCSKAVVSCDTMHGTHRTANPKRP